MDGIRTASRSRIRRGGGVLLELLLAIALFAAAASFTLSSLRAALDSVARAERRARAYDAAASRLAELDAGLIAVGDLGEDLEVDGDLLVAVEVEPSPASDLVRARAVVRDRSVSADETPVITQVERWFESRERGGAGSR
jgi:type II secretory pathway pseudopilin PulG